MSTLVRTVVGRVDLRRLPWVLFASAVVLALLGALFIASAASPHYAKRHLQFLVLGIVVFFCAALVDYRHLAGLAAPLYTAGVLALAGLYVLGRTVNNARRWYGLGPINVQPSEAMKYVMIIALATYFTYRARVERLRDLAVPLGLTMLPMALIVKQPDLGTTMLFLPIFFAAAFLAGVPMRNLAVLVVAGAVVAAGAWLTPGALKEYQKDRIRSFLDHDYDRGSPASYNAEQATLAIAGGGVTGQGWGRGLLNRLRRVPERHTDFIFPVIAEEWGFVRTAVVMLFYLLVILLLARITWDTDDPFGMMIAGGVMTMFGFQALLHMAISLRLAPITGLTLPLMSYGGSSLVCTFGGLGLVAGVAMRQVTEFPQLRHRPHGDR